jgi:YD repeat-containing protein
MSAFANLALAALLMTDVPTAQAALWLSLDNGQLKTTPAAALEPTHLLHVFEDVDIGAPHSAWILPVLASSLSPYDGDALFWRHPVTGIYWILRRPQTPGLFEQVPGTPIRVRRLTGDRYEIAESSFLFRYESGRLVVAEDTASPSSLRLEVECDGQVVNLLYQRGAEERSYRVEQSRDDGRLLLFRGTATAQLQYSADGQLTELTTTAGTLRLEYTDRLLTQIVTPQRIQRCRWQGDFPRNRAMSFSDLAKLREPKLVLTSAPNR